MSLTWKRAFLLAGFCLQVPSSVWSVEYKLLKDHSGATFFAGWKFFDAPDTLNNGDVEFIGPDEAFNPATSLAYVDPVTNRAILKVDSTTPVVWDNKRKSVRITTEDAYDFGSVFIADIYHYPYGCSVWSSFWSWHEPAGLNWPQGGEIDIFEAINMAPTSQMGLHTSPGCIQPDAASVRQLTTQVMDRNCTGSQFGTEGCIVANTDPASYGPPLNQAGGGMHIAELAESGISMWFFSRDKIPESLKNNPQSVDTATFGTPMGYWPATETCDLKRFFKPQNIVMKITLCGDFARGQFNQTGCQGRCYEDFVLGDPGRYADAYFDVASVRIYSEGGASSGNASSSASRPSGTPTGRPGNSSAETSEPEGGAAVPVKVSSVLVVTAILVATFALV